MTPVEKPLASDDIKLVHRPAAAAEMPKLASARYGKENVRVYKVHKDAETGFHTVTEMTVSCLLEGEIDVS